MEIYKFLGVAFHIYEMNTPIGKVNELPDHFKQGFMLPDPSRRQSDPEPAGDSWRTQTWSLALIAEMTRTQSGQRRFSLNPGMRSILREAAAGRAAHGSVDSRPTSESGSAGRRVGPPPPGRA
jgi:hypothetical protein